MFCPIKLANQSNIDENLLGNFKLRKIEYEDSIDLKKLECFSLKTIFSDINNEYSEFSIIAIDSYDDGTIAIIYLSTSNKLRLSMIDQQNRSIHKSMDMDFECVNINEFRITNKDFIVIGFGLELCQEHAVIINSKFECIMGIESC